MNVLIATDQKAREELAELKTTVINLAVLVQALEACIDRIIEYLPDLIEQKEAGDA